MVKLILEYDSMHGDVVVDSKIRQYVEDTILCINEKKTVYRKVGSTLLFNMFRAAIVEDKIDHRNIIIRFKEKEYRINKKGGLNEYPEGLADIDIYILDTILKWTK